MCPLLPATVVATWFPITCAATMVIASDWVGFTFPGMIEDPGSFDGRTSSPRPRCSRYYGDLWCLSVRSDIYPSAGRCNFPGFITAK